MAVAGCTKCIKYMLFFFNFVFWLAGGVILGMALWLRHDSQTSKLLILQFDGQQAPSTFYISVYILIAVGAVMMLVGFLGCYGAIQESQCLLGTFFFFLVILFACEVAAALWGFMNKDTVRKLRHAHTSLVIDVSAFVPVNASDARLPIIHRFPKNSSIFTTLLTSRLWMCQTPPVKTHCHTKLTWLFSEKLYLIGLAALAVAVIMVFEMIFTMVLCCGIRNSPGVY
uniref:CD81 antigen n=1 Tax=Oryzias latipes TaxID=8090 RepID=A0A3P9KLB5_ORYLA